MMGIKVALRLGPNVLFSSCVILGFNVLICQMMIMTKPTGRDDTTHMEALAASPTTFPLLKLRNFKLSGVLGRDLCTCACMCLKTMWKGHTRRPGMGTGQDMEGGKEGLFMLHPPERLEFLPCIRKITRQRQSLHHLGPPSNEQV